MGFRKLRDCTIYVAKTKALISFAFNVKLICFFVFAYAKSWFSHDVAHMTKQYTGTANFTAVKIDNCDIFAQDINFGYS